MFLGNPQLDLLKGDISDERIAIQREEAITENDFMTIFDRTQDMKYEYGTNKEELDYPLVSV